MLPTTVLYVIKKLSHGCVYFRRFDTSGDGTHRCVPIRLWSGGNSGSLLIQWTALLVYNKLVDVTFIHDV